MAGTFTLNNSSQSLTGNALVTGVYRYIPAPPSGSGSNDTSIEDGDIDEEDTGEENDDGEETNDETDDEEEENEEETEEEQEEDEGGDDDDDPSQPKFSLIPNVTWRRIDNHEGPHPSNCQFAYKQDNTLQVNMGWPSQFEAIWPIDTVPGPYVVHNDDRLVVLAQNPDGSMACLFDGFAQIPQADVTATTQNVTFTGVSVAARLWDFPVGGRFQRHSDSTGIVDTSGESDIRTNLVTRFNPVDRSITVGNKGGYIPNKTPDNFDTNSVGNDASQTYVFPVFVDPNVVLPANPPAYWTISTALKYLMVQYNQNEVYVTNPQFSTLEKLLQSDYPTTPEGIFDPTDCSSEDILIRDYDATNKYWPEVVAELLSYAGFVMRFDTSMSSDGVTPQTQLLIYRRDAADALAPKLVYLDTAGSTVDPSRNNVSRMHLQRDCNAIQNAYRVETPSKRVEATFALAPLFQIAAGDGAAASRTQFLKSSWTPATTAATRRAYRWYGVDELGEGCQQWSAISSTWQKSTTPFDFSVLFPNDNDGNMTYARRYRPCSQSIISLDSEGHPLDRVLHIYFPGVANAAVPAIPFVVIGDKSLQTLNLPTSQIFRVNDGFTLLEGRLGIEITINDPNEWHIGNPAALNGGKVNGVEWIANPAAANLPIQGLPFILFLTTVISDDENMKISVGIRLASPTVFERIGAIDARDHFQFNSVAVGSYYYKQDGGNGTDPFIARDDTQAALTHAYQLRSAHEMPPLAGMVGMPFITQYYEVGDRISQISGRNVSLQTNIGADQGEAPEYPWVIGVSWINESDRQGTELQFTDFRRPPRNL
jgi:hypothetical protein